MRTPVSTYRLQITEDFDLFEAARRLPYLHDLGVDWVYLSPLLAAEPGSTHGYDVVALDHIDASRGGAEGLAAAVGRGPAARPGRARRHRAQPRRRRDPDEDAWWWDVLQHGRESEHATAFDIDWAAGDGRLLIPVVGTTATRPSIERRPATGELRYHDQRFPLGCPATTRRHDEQHYELVNWHVADDDLNYRRFFAVNTPRRRPRRGPRGLRRDPRRDPPLVRRGPRRRAAGRPPRRPARPEALPRRPRRPDRRRLRAGREDPRARRGAADDWATAGHDRVRRPRPTSTGCSPTRPARQPLDALEARLRGGPVDWAELIHDTKRAVADGILRSEVRRITREVRRS